MIIAILTVTVIMSLVGPAGRALTILGQLRRETEAYIHGGPLDGADERARLWTSIVKNEHKLGTVESKYFGDPGERWELEQLLQQAYAVRQRFGDEQRRGDGASSGELVASRT